MPKRKPFLRPFAIRGDVEKQIERVNCVSVPTCGRIVLALPVTGSDLCSVRRSRSSREPDRPLDDRRLRHAYPPHRSTPFGKSEGHYNKKRPQNICISCIVVQEKNLYLKSPLKLPVNPGVNKLPNKCTRVRAKLLKIRLWGKN